MTLQADPVRLLRNLYWSLLLVGVVSFECIPDRLIGLFSQDPAVLAIGVPAFRIIGLSFIPAVLSLMPPVFFRPSERRAPACCCPWCGRSAV